MNLNIKRSMTYMTYFELHLHELKYHFFLFIFTFLYLFIICYIYSNQLIFLFSKIFIQSNMLKYFIFTNITEVFITNLSLAMTISFFISFHFIIIQSWFFFSSGLFQYENFKMLKFYLFFLFFNFFIINIILMKMIPNIWFFFIHYTFSNEYLLNIYFEPKLNTFFNFIFFSFIYLYLLFFYFFILFYMIIYKIFKIKTIVHLRKIFYLKFIIIATFIAPPDIYSQVIISFIFIFFFEIYIFFYLYISKYFI